MNRVALFGYNDKASATKSLLLDHWYELRVVIFLIKLTHFHTEFDTKQIIIFYDYIIFVILPSCYPLNLVCAIYIYTVYIFMFVHKLLLFLVIKTCMVNGIVYLYLSLFIVLLYICIYMTRVLPPKSINFCSVLFCSFKRKKDYKRHFDISKHEAHILVVYILSILSKRKQFIKRTTAITFAVIRFSGLKTAHQYTRKSCCNVLSDWRLL